MSPAHNLPAGVLPGGRFPAWQGRRARYVVCDVDGTLVGPQALATASVADAVAHAQQAGIRVGIATGRMRDAIVTLQAQLATLGPDVLHNGAEVRDRDALVVGWTLLPEQVDRLLTVAAEHDDVVLEVYGEHGFHVSSWDLRTRPHWDLLGTEPRGVVRRAAELDDGPVPKATFAILSDDAGDWLLERLAGEDVAIGTAGSPRTPGLTFTNVTHPDVDKGVALRAAAAHLGMDLAEVAAIGDATNDLPMLAVAGTAIAMGQAAPDVVAAAHLVVPDVMADGAAVALDLLRARLVGAGA